MMPVKITGKDLKDYRNKLGMSVEEFAEMLSKLMHPGATTEWVKAREAEPDAVVPSGPVTS
jgi:DNA-binding transcriptional regulator YiaG